MVSRSVPSVYKSLPRHSPSLSMYSQSEGKLVAVIGDEVRSNKISLIGWSIVVSNIMTETD